MSEKKIFRNPFKPIVQFLHNTSPQFRTLNEFRYRFGKFPNLIKPKTFNERLIFKMLFDRNPKLTMFADKYLVRRFVEQKCGSEILTKLYAVTDDAEKIPTLLLANKFVMKPNHLSGVIKIVKDLKDESIEELIKLGDDWLRRNYCDFENEWAYKNIRPVLMFEELLESNNAVPDDYKFFCFKGDPQFVQIDKGRFTNHRRNFYDINLSLLPVKFVYENFPDRINPPINFNNMIEIVKNLSEGTDFIRVDLYNIEGRIVFGELTNYPEAGLGKFVPAIWDEKLGSYWK